MTDYVISPPAVPSLPVAGSQERFPVRRIFCVGRNYTDHAREMGHDPDREPPFFFDKPADALVVGDADIPYPTLTKRLEHEAELVVALGNGVAWQLIARMRSFQSCCAVDCENGEAWILHLTAIVISTKAVHSLKFIRRPQQIQRRHVVVLQTFR